jgi:hypothetical protein
MTSSENSIDCRLTGIENRINSLENGITNLDHKFDTRFDLLLSKVIEIDNRR